MHYKLLVFLQLPVPIVIQNSNPRYLTSLLHQMLPIGYERRKPSSGKWPCGTLPLTIGNKPQGPTRSIQMVR
ncbi:unnamed protein product [Schistocephalus solidus]|uniref:Secreted protein n=1 Tax=Schistocephalus solidus TaxID=70667 RepID=A0A183T956_SCHSO|nr:unnamed protein product [Schistocephalus solidus]